MNVKFWAGFGLLAGGAVVMAVSSPWWILKSIYDWATGAEEFEVGKIFSKLKEFLYNKSWKPFSRWWDDYKSKKPYTAFALDFIGAIAFYFVLTFITAGIGGAAALAANTINAFGLKAAVAGWSTVAMNAIAAVLFAGFVKVMLGIPKLIQMVFSNRSMQEFLSRMGYAGRAIAQKVNDFFNKGNWIKKGALLIFPILASLSLAFPVISSGLAHIFGNAFAEFIASSPGLVGIILVPAMIFTGIALVAWGVTAYQNRTPEAKLAKAAEREAKQSIEAQAGAKRKAIMNRMSSSDSTCSSSPPKPTEKEMEERVAKAMRKRGTVAQAWHNGSANKHRPGVASGQDIESAIRGVEKQEGISISRAQQGQAA